MKPWEKYSPGPAGPWAKYAQSAQAEPAEQGFGAALDREIRDIPRTAGMFGRFTLEGLGNVGDFITLAPRTLLNPILEKIGLPRGEPGMGKDAADALNLPEPRNATERVVGDVARTVAGTAGGIGVAGKASEFLSGVPGAVTKLMASRPDAQLASAVGAGGAGGYVKETGGGPVAEFLAALAGGVAGTGTLAAGKKVVAGVSSIADRLKGSPDLNFQIDAAIENAVKSSGLTLQDLPTNVTNQLRTDIKKALEIGELSPDAVRRLSDYRLIGATPTAANLTLDPAAITQQRNLTKMGANSQDPALQTLARVQNQNNRVLIDRMNDAGAATDPKAASEKIISSLATRNDQAKSVIDTAYQSARETSGRSASLDPAAFTQKANDLLDDALLGGKLPADVRNKLNQIATAKMPLTIDVAEQLKTRIGELQRATVDGAERKALGLVRQALDGTPLLDGQGQQAIDAFNKARQANKAWMEVVERTPALQAVRDGVEPDKFVESFLVGTGKDATDKSVFNLSQQIKSDPEAMGAVKGAITGFLKNKALSGASDEVGNVSQSAYNRALSSIGERKLAMFFSPLEVQQIKAVGRVASYEQIQPAGSAVNNSNTATTLMSTLLDKIGGSPLLRKIPLGAEILGDPLRSVSGSIKATRAINIPKSLILQNEKARKLPPVLLPLLIEQQSSD